MFFKKSVKKATKKFRGLRSDLTQIISQEAQVQRDLDKEIVKIKVKHSISANEMDEAQAILMNVNAFLGKVK